jgi:hypothetical protein
MKKALVIAALSAALPITVYAAHAGTYKLHNFKIMNTKHQKVFDCSQLSDLTVTANKNDRKQYINKHYYLKDAKWWKNKGKKGLTRYGWKAKAVIIGENGKKYHTMTYGYEVGMKGARTAFGSFANDYCRGFYKVTW